jgi:type IV pilus assembly protein PilC
MAAYWFLLLIATVILIGMAIEYVQTPEGNALLDDLKIRLPVVSKVYLPVTITRFADASAMLIKGGVPVAQAMEIVGETVDNTLYQDILHEVSNDIRQGMPLSQAIAKYPDNFPPLVSQMLAVGEATGQLDEIFVRIGNFYGRQADGVVNNLVELIQPVLMIGIGLMVGLLFAAILLPLYRLTSAFQ